MRLVPAAVLAAAVCALAACSSSGPSPTTSAPRPSTPSTSAATSAPTSAPASSTAPTTAATSTAPGTSSSRPPASSATRAASPPPFTTTCRSLSVDVIKGGAIRGMEIAAMQFTNNGSSPCTITGAPTATLLLNGAPVGPSSTPNDNQPKPFTLQPGEYGEALLRDSSTCDAPLSDSLRLQAPSRNGVTGTTVTQPIRLRACTLRVAPVGVPS